MKSALIKAIGLKVSDSLLEDTDTTSVTVNDLAPTAAFTWTPEPRAEGAAVSFTDASVSSPDIITGWSWDFGGIETSSEQNPSFTFGDNGVYTVTLTVIDEDGSTDTVSHDVTITDRAPVANLTGDTSLNEGSTGNYDARGSSSTPDAIVNYEWDWNYDGGVGSDTLTVTVKPGGVPPEQTIFDLAARPKSGKVQLTWSVVAGADCYNVYRSQTSGGTYTNIADCHVTDYCTYLDYNVVNGTTYYYVVRSVTQGTESLDSNEVNATPQAKRRR